MGEKAKTAKVFFLRTTFCELVQNKEYRETLKTFDFFPKRGKRSTEGTIRTIVEAVRARQSKDFRIFLMACSLWAGKL